jgi:ribosomal protein S18 acetylase RimI-like enzyme
MSDSEFSIRNYRSGDRDDVLALWDFSFAGDPPRNEPSQVIERKQREKDELFFVGVLERRVVATVLAGFDGVRGWVYHLAVAPKLRRRGLAGRLMDHAEEELLARGCPKLNLQVRTSNVEVVAFYEGRGYAVDQVISLGKVLIEATAVRKKP